jgi:FemAB-related protein (PEP-CTERM system-associated)
VTLTVDTLDNVGIDRWNAYVAENASASFFHRAEWQQILEQAFGHRTHFLCVREENTLRGLLPLAQVKSFLFGNNLSSLPFCVYGGIVADNDQAEEALRTAACDLARELKVDALELRNQSPSTSGWPSKDLYFTFKKTIDPDDDVNLKAIPNRQRAMIRKGAKAGLESEWDSDWKRIYQVYSESVRNLGTPVFSKKYMRLLMEVFGDDCSVLMITHEGRDIAGVMNFYHRGEVLPYYGGSIAAAREVKGTNDFMYWELMRRSREQGCTSFDFGRSKAGTGPFKFKKNWGFEPQPLPYEYFLVQAEELPNLSPNNPKYRLLIDTWSRLPLPVANTFGPLVAPYLG